MNIEEILNLPEIHAELNKLIKSDFREIQKKFADLKEKYLEKYLKTPNSTPKTKQKAISKTPSTHFSTPRLTPKRKLKLTPQKFLSSSKSSKKNSENSNITPESIFGHPLKVNLREIFQDYVSSSDESKGKYT